MSRSRSGMWWRNSLFEWHFETFWGERAEASFSRQSVNENEWTTGPDSGYECFMAIKEIPTSVIFPGGAVFRAWLKPVLWCSWFGVILFLLVFNEAAGRSVPFNTELSFAVIWSRVNLWSGAQSLLDGPSAWITLVGGVWVTAQLASGKDLPKRKAAVLIGILLPALHGFPEILWGYLFCPLGFLMNLGDLMSGKADGELFQDAGFYSSGLFFWLVGCVGADFSMWLTKAGNEGPRVIRGKRVNSRF